MSAETLNLEKNIAAWQTVLRELHGKIIMGKFLSNHFLKDNIYTKKLSSSLDGQICALDNEIEQ